MKNKLYLKEFQFFDGEDSVVFNILSVDGDKITVAVTKLRRQNNGKLRKAQQKTLRTVQIL